VMFSVRPISTVLVLPVLPSWVPSIAGTPATLSADFTTEGATNHYWANGQQYAGFSAWLAALGGTYTRASSATYTQSGVLQTATSNTARFPTDINGTPIGIAITGGAGTNIILHSAVDASWTGQIGTLTPAAVTGPDGTTSAATFVPGTGTNNHGAFLTAGTTYTAAVYTVSIFAKNNGYNFLLMDPVNGGSGGAGYATFDLTTGTSVTTGASAVAAGMVQLASGWWYCWFTFTFTSGTKNNIFGALPTSTYATYAGNGTSGISIFGAQAVLGTTPFDYIPTTTATATQAQDLPSFPYTMTTLTVASTVQSVIGQGGGLIITPTNINGRLLIMSPTQAATEDSTAGVLACSIGGAITDLRKIASTGGPSGRAVTGQNTTPASDANPLIVGTPTSLRIGSDLFSDTPLIGNIRSLSLWSGLQVSNSQLQGLTV
jgi:hypothetical protein